MAKFLILGGNGRLAQALFRHLYTLRHHHDTYYPTNKFVDITSSESIFGAVNNYVPDIVINCAGVLPPTTETNRDLALQVNTFGAIRVARITDDAGARLIQISTDAVFSGKIPPAYAYRESDGDTPVNEYGFTKQIAELVISRSNPSALILRVPFRHRGPWPHTRAFTDAYRSSRWVDEVVPDIIQAALMPDLTGILHMGGLRRSVYDMAKEASPDVQPCLLEDFKDFPVPRDLTLDSSKWERIKRERGLCK